MLLFVEYFDLFAEETATNQLFNVQKTFMVRLNDF